MAAPRSVTAPQQHGFPSSGQTAKTDNGGWDSDHQKPITGFTYQWYVATDPAAPDPGTDATAASTTSSYTFDAGGADEGKQFYCKVGAVNADGTTYALSNVSAAVGAVLDYVLTYQGHAFLSFSSLADLLAYCEHLALIGQNGGRPINSTGPTLSTPPASSGLPTGFTPSAPDLAYFAAVVKGSAVSLNVLNPGRPLSEALADIATFANQADAGDFTQAQEDAAVAAGVAAAIAALKPVFSAVPTITGTVQDGQVLTAHAGTSSHGPSTPAYQWQTSADGTTGWANIGGEASATYTISGQTGKFLRVVEIDTNAAGASAASDSLATVAVIA